MTNSVCYSLRDTILPRCLPLSHSPYCVADVVYDCPEHDGSVRILACQVAFNGYQAAASLLVFRNCTSDPVHQNTLYIAGAHCAASSDIRMTHGGKKRIHNLLSTSSRRRSLLWHSCNTSMLIQYDTGYPDLSQPD